MREILFRGKRIDNGEWVEGFFVAKADPLLGIMNSYILTQELDDNGILRSHMAWYKVDPETVGQYTGLIDKNGTKVFEGDILKFTDTNAEYEWIGKVEFGNPNAEYNWGFQLVYISGTKPNIDILLWFDMEETGAHSEVIGNIHDNPELLEEG